MKRIILHIGTPKTGSTALQYFFVNEAKTEALEEAHTGYYEHTRTYDPWEGNANGDFLLAETLHRLGEPKDREKLDFLHSNPSLDIVRLRLDEDKIDCLRKEKENFAEYVDRYDTVILSDEALWHYEIFYPDFWDTVKEYLMECCGRDVIIDVVVYLRRQDKWMLSKWKEDMVNELPDPWDFRETLSEYERIGYLDYDSSMERLEKVFGKEHIVIRNYERRALSNGDICYDFLEACGLDADRIVPERDPINVYHSISIESAYAMSRINKRQFKSGRSADRLYLYDASKRLTNMRNKGDQVQSKEEREDLLLRCSESNGRISERYLNSTPLFDGAIEEGILVRPNLLRDLLNAVLIRLIAIKRNLLRDLLNAVLIRLIAIKRKMT